MSINFFMSIKGRISSILFLLEESCSEGQCSESPEGSDTEQSCCWRNHQRDLNCDCSGLGLNKTATVIVTALDWAGLSIQTILITQLAGLSPNYTSNTGWSQNSDRKKTFSTGFVPNPSDSWNILNIYDALCRTAPIFYRT